mgnify:CR=1 FL=1
MYKKLLAIFMVILSFSSFAKNKLKIGVTLQPYYSFAVNIVKDRADVIPVVRLDQYDSHSYQPKPDDIKRMNTLDVLIVNGIGHDEFIFDILNSADRKKDIKVIYANKNVSLMPIAGSIRAEKVMNPHTFISITTSIQQVYNIAKELGEIDPANKEFYLKNSNRIFTRVKNYVQTYINICSKIELEKPITKRTLRPYQYSTLRNFHSELGISISKEKFISQLKKS